MLSTKQVIFFLITTICLSSCSLVSISNIHEIVPVRHFFANSDGKFDYQISPDGQSLSWFELAKGERIFKLRSLGSSKTDSLKVPFKGGYFWADNNRYIGYPIFSRNEKRTSIAIFDTHNPNTPPFRLLPQYEGSLYLVEKIMSENVKLLIKHRREGKDDNFILVDLIKQESKEVSTEGRGIVEILLQSEQVIAQVRKDKNRRIVELLDRKSNKFKPVAECTDNKATIELLSHDKEGYLNYSSDCHSEHIQLVRINGSDEIRLGSCDSEKACEANFQQLVIHPETGVPVFGIFYQEESHLVAFNNRINFQPINQLPGVVEIASYDKTFKKLIIKNSYYAGVSHYLWDIEAHVFNQLSKPQSEKYQSLFSEPQFFDLRKEDGDNLFGYYYAPQTHSVDAPAIIILHGGPVERSYPDYDKDAQFFSNRGYHVLSLNYRGSVGFSKHYQRQAQNRPQLMLDDIDVAQNWLRKEKLVAAPIGVFGGSYGGYLSILASQSETFSCVASLNGIVDLHETARRFPVQDNNIFTQYFGERLNSNPEVYYDFSPVKLDYKNKKILLLHSEFDDRVPIDLTEKFYRLNKDKNQIQFKRFEDGHILSKWYNRMEAYRDIEVFFSDCLGGIDGGYDYYLLAKPFFQLMD